MSNESKTILLSTPKIFSDKNLKHILNQLLNFEENNTLFKRVYKTLSVEHLGSIYEGLLSCFFELAYEDNTYDKCFIISPTIK